MHNEYTVQISLDESIINKIAQRVADSMSLDFLHNKYEEPQIKEDGLIKIDELAKMLNVSKVTIHAWKKSGKIPFLRLNSRVYFRKDEVLAAMKKINGGAL